MSTALDRPAYDKVSSPAATPAEDLTKHPAYQLALQHMAEGKIQAPGVAGGTPAATGLSTGPVAGAVGDVVNTVAGNLPRPLPVAGAQPAAGTAATTGAALVAANLAAKQPLIDETARKSAGISPADAARRNPANDPLSNGFFKTAAQRADVEASRFPGALPRPTPAPAVAVAPPTPPVGGTAAVVDPSTGFNGNTRTPGVKTVDPVQARYGEPGKPTKVVFDSTPGTRRPFIAGGDGVNVAGNFADVNDKTLDKGYIAGLPARTPAVAPPRLRNQIAERKKPAFFTNR